MSGKTVSPRLKEIEDNFVKNGGSFKEFRIGELFEIQRITSRLSQLDIRDDTHIPVYSSNTANGGIYGYTDKAGFYITEECPCYLVFGDHTRTFNIARCDFAVMDNVKVLKPAEKFSDESLMYIITVWKKQIPDYGYSRHWRYASKCAIRLPVDDNRIAFDYMENFIRELEMERIRELEMERIRELEMERIRELDAYLKVTGLNDTELTDDEKECLEKGEICLKEFRIGELFEIHTTKSYGYTNDKLFSSKGTVPVVVNSSQNNGIGGRVNLEPMEKRIMITFSDTTTAESIFVQDEPFVGYSHIQGLYPHQKNWSVESLLYFATLFRKNATQMKFDYANKFNRTKASNMIVSLPVCDNRIAFDTMEIFIRAMEKLCIRSVVEWKDKIIETTKRIVDANASSDA